MKKKDKVLIGIIGTAGLGLLAYYLMKKSAGQPSPQPSPSPSPSPQPSGNLTISNYTLSWDTNAQSILAKGTVLYNNQPVSNNDVIGGFCSQYPSAITDTLTDNNGNFSFHVYTSSYGGANCIFAQTSYKGYTATVKATIQIPTNPIIPPNHIHPM
ncbi:MAG: hypothetical protein QXW71_01000 [Thermoplasmata archaeon]